MRTSYFPAVSNHNNNSNVLSMIPQHNNKTTLVQMARSFSTVDEMLEFVGYTAAVLIGLPINLITFLCLVRRFCKKSTVILLLHLNLNITDVLVSWNYSAE
jgi:hypothetical protein